MPDAQRMGTADWVLLLLLSCLWGGSFFFAKIIVRELPPLTLVLARFASAAVFLGLYLRASRMAVPRSASVWMAFTGMGVLNNLIPAALIAWAQMTITSGLASILVATTPVFSMFAAHCLTSDEELSAGKLLGAALGIGGVAVLVSTSMLSATPRSVAAVLGCLAASASYGLANVFGRQFRSLGIPPLVSPFGQITATAILVFPASLLIDAPWRLPVPGWNTWLSLLCLALASTALAYAIFFRILRNAGGTNVSLVTLLIPVSTLLLGGTFLQERIAPVQLAAMALIAFGLMLIDGRLASGLHSRSGRGDREPARHT